MRDPLQLDGTRLTIDGVVAAARDGTTVTARAEALEDAARSREAVERLMTTGDPIYGVNTGFGKLASVRVPPHQLLELQRNLIRSHVAGVGQPLPAEVVRAAMVLRANVLLRPTSGVRPVVIQRVLDLLNAGIHPVVPEQGSVGASGDLAPLSHIAWALMGEGEVEVGERRTLHDSPFTIHDSQGREAGNVKRETAASALSAAGIPPLEFQAKEGLAFINGTQVQTALLALAVHDARNLWRTAVGAAAMSLEALRGTPAPFDARIHEARPHDGQVRTAALLRELLSGSEIREQHREGDPRVQDAYSLRCTPQILGAVGDAIGFAARVADVELNASTDNPLVFGDEIVSGGNFHGQPVALALDILAIALTTLAGLAERRLERLVNPDLSHGLPPFLTQNAGLHSGYMMMQVTAAALVAESRSMSAPASVQSIPTDANQEDVVPMGMAAAMKASRILRNAQRVVACELIAGAQGLELQPLRPGAGVATLFERIRALVPALQEDRPLTHDIERVAAVVAREALV